MFHYITKHLKELFSTPNLSDHEKTDLDSSSKALPQFYRNEDTARRFSKKSSNPLRMVWNDVKKHKLGYIGTSVAEGVWLKYLFDLRNVATNALVEEGLKRGFGQVIKYPIRVEIFWPRIVDVRGQTPMDPLYETDVVKYVFLSLARNPTALCGLATIPIIAYGVYRFWKYKRGKKLKNIF